MPIYIFECNACGRTAEVLQSFADKWPDCSACEKQMKKKPALTSFRLEGAGWAKDGYGDKRTMSKEEKIERSTVKTTSTNTKTGETKVVSEKPLEARSLVDD